MQLKWFHVDPVFLLLLLILHIFLYYNFLLGKVFRLFKGSSETSISTYLCEKKF